MDLCNSAEYATAMAQAALNDGLDPVAYASNYGLNLNASQGIGIQAYDPKTGQYNSYTMNGLYDGYINSKKTMRFSDTTGLTPSPAQVSHRATTCRFPMLPTSIPHSFL